MRPVHHDHRRSLRTLATLGVCMMMTLGGPAHAEEGELVGTFGGGVLLSTHGLNGSTIARIVPYADGGVRYAVSDFWEIGGMARVGGGLGGGQRPELVAQTFFEARFIIDALTWVPFLAAGVGLLIRSDGTRAWEGHAGPQFDATAHLGGGVEYRPERGWSLGLAFRYHATLSDLSRTVGPFDLAITYSFYTD